MKISKLFALSIIATTTLGLFACDSDSDNSPTTTPAPSPAPAPAPAPAPDPTPEVPARCVPSGSDVNWDGLSTEVDRANENCESLSAFNLFSDPTNPTANPNGSGVMYELSTELFTDYTSKYRFVFLPDGTQATYTKNEVMHFPVGTVIVKTFSLPKDTADRGFEYEDMVETRLLIHRENGWTALPYVWNEDKTDAVLEIAASPIEKTIIHNGVSHTFDYQVPDVNMCKQCHQMKVEADSPSVFVPIGPKARLLNMDVDFGEGAENQLAKWAEMGLLTGLPSDMSSIVTVPAYKDSDAANLTMYNDEQVMALAKGYLDINCAHCHRPEGNASNTGLHLEYWRDYMAEKGKHGVCKKPIAFGGGSLEYDIIPGNAERSILHYRMSTNKAGDKMPEIGRQVQHEEAVMLIESWINRLPAESCS